jgi:hypothetical protein
MIQDKFTQDEWNNLVEKVNKITNHIPEHEMGLIWDAYKRIAQVNTVQPCGCPSAARYWVEAINVIRNYILDHI